MLNFPKTTEINKQLPKKAIYLKFQMNNIEKEKIDEDVSKIIITNELSTERTSFEAGETIKSFFVLHILLKRKNYKEKTIATLSKIIPQNILFVLECEGEYRLAIYHTKLIQTEWEKEVKTIELKGLNLESVWEGIVTQIGNIKIEDGRTLTEQIENNDEKEKLLQEICRLEKQARGEKQPRKKFDLVQKINKLKREGEK